MLTAAVLGALDWVALATVATAVATLVLAIATFASVRAAARSARAAEDAVYFAIPVRNVGPGLAVLDAWHFRPGRRFGNDDHADLAEFRRLTRDLYIPPGDVGFWQGAI